METFSRIGRIESGHGDSTCHVMSSSALLRQQGPARNNDDTICPHAQTGFNFLLQLNFSSHVLYLLSKRNTACPLCGSANFNKYPMILELLDISTATELVGKQTVLSLFKGPPFILFHVVKSPVKIKPRPY